MLGPIGDLRAVAVVSIDPFIYHVTTAILLACAAYAGFQAYEGRSSDWRLISKRGHGGLPFRICGCAGDVARHRLCDKADSHRVMM